MNFSGPWSNLETGKANLSELDPRTEPSTFDALGLTWTQRLYGFFGCTATAFILSFIGAIMFIVGQTVIFAFLYTVGVLISLVGTGFLITFSRQLKLMFKPVRLTAVLLMLGSIVMVFISAFVLGLDVLVIIFAVSTYLSYFWYSLSYIPFARAFAKKIFAGLW